VYYIASQSDYTETIDGNGNFYLVPAANPQQLNYQDAYYSPNYAESPGDPEKPFLTTYKTNKDMNSIWIVKKTGSYYYVIHAVTGKYVIYEVPLPNDPNKNNESDETKNGKRKTMHLQTPDDEAGTGTYRLSANNNYQFNVTLVSNTYRFQPINRSGWYWNPASGNKNTYYGQNATLYHYGMVGVYNNSSDNGSQWRFENAKLPAPTIEYDTDNDKFVISYDKIPAGFDILYTTDGSEPTIGGITTHTFTNETAISLATIGDNPLKAVVVRYGLILSETASQRNPNNPTITPVPGDCNNLVSISAEEGTDIYYTLDGTNPTSSSTPYAEPFALNSDATIKAVAYSGNLYSGIVTYNYTPNYSAKPTITTTIQSGITVTLSGAGTIYYTINGDEPTTSSTQYTNPFPLTGGSGEVITIKAVAKDGSKGLSCVAQKAVTMGYFISNLSQLEAVSSHPGDLCILAADINASGFSSSISNFTGVFDGGYHTISGLSKPLFDNLNGGTVKNVVFDPNTTVSGNGAICNEADGATKIYNCGVLSGTVSGSGNVGALVGHIKSGSSVRVVNCYSYANVSGSDCAAGIVGKNDGTVGDVRIAMCMMYGTVSGATTISPVYAGNHTSNAQNYTEYNYYLYSTQKDALGQRIIRIPYTKASGTTPSAYNDQLAIDKEEYLTRFPFYRHILNTHRELAAYFLFGDYSEEHVNEIGHWAVKKGDNAHKYPIVESWVKNKTNTTPTETNNDLPNTTADYAGKLLTTMGISGYLSVSIKIGGNNYSAKLPITDMDTLRNDYTYGKVILPFANEYKVNTDYSKICTGWKITGVSGGTAGTFENYNFADRDCTAKDIYNENTNPFIYAQGGYYIVPTGVKGITIEANFAEAVYLSDATYEIGYNSSYGGRTGVGDNISGFHGQTVYNSLKDAVDALSTATTNPHKQAIVLVGNYHYDLAKGDLATTSGFTLMSIDADNNQEPDYGFYSIAPDRPQTPALRFDFVPIIPLGMAAKVNGSNYYPGIPIWNSRGWYEQTETTVSIMNQFELDSGNFTKDEKDYEGKGQNPCIINGGYFVQMIRSRNTNCSKVSYFKIGGNAYIKEFYPGSHSSNAKNTTIVPVNVTGGQVDECYMTGYKSGAKAIGTDIRFWCSGGKIGKFLGAYMDTPMQTSSSVGNVNMTAKIDHALIGRFFGGGTSPNAAITGDINITINNSKVDFYCGGPEFGNMSAGKTVKTTANNTIFGKYYGAGFGGTAITYSPVDGSPSIGSSVTFPSGSYTYSSSTEGRLKSNGSLGLATCYKFEFLMHSADKSKLVARFITGYAKFDLATTGNVTNELTGCRVLNDFYGAGCQGKVNGTVTSTLTGCKIRGSAFGGGFKAESNEVQVYPADAPTLSVYNGETGIFSEFGTTTPETFTWVAGTENPDNAGHKLYTGMTEEHMKELGNVTGAISLTINGDSVAVNVFGGGNESQSLDNASVTIEGNTKVLGSVYGGGNIASVGTFTKDANGKPTSCADNTGKCTVVIKGNAEIGPDGMRMTRAGGPDDKGHVFGAGKGLMADPADKADIDFTAYVGNTDVTIKGNAFIKGSVYGGSESGHVLLNTDVKIQGGQIGCGKETTEPFPSAVWEDTYVPTDENNLDCASWEYKAPYAPYDPFANATGDLDKYPNEVSTDGGRRVATDGHTYYGNVFGGGSGCIPYFDEVAGTSKYLKMAGTVEGNTNVTISGGHILTNVYGGCETTNVLGKAVVTMTGGTVGVPRTVSQIVKHPLTGYVFGAGKGDQRIFFNKETNVDEAIVNIEGGWVYGSVFGGGEDGHILKNSTVTIGKDGATGPTIGTQGLSFYDGNVFGGGRGFGGEALTAGNVGGSVELNIKSGKILGSVYGGGRLASVGYGLYLVDDEVDGVKPYGILRPDDQYDGSYPNPSTEPASSYYNKGRGYITVNISGGTIGNDAEYKYYNPTEAQKAAMPNTTFDYQNHLQYTKGGNVFAGGMGRLYALDGTTLLSLWPKLGKCKQTTLNITGGTIKSSVYGGGEIGVVAQNATVNITGGTIGTKIVDSEDATKYYYFGSVFGGGKGSTANIIYPDGTAEAAKVPISEAGSTEGNVLVELNKGVAEDAKGGVVRQIFGCNDMNGTPKGTVTVHVYATQTNGEDDISTKPDKDTDTYDVMAVYGGGNLAAYEPTDLETGKAEVIIEGCGLTSIRQVYGGGNAASTPATDVEINGTYEIAEVFGGGNGLDALPNGRPNPGANVGYKNYTIYEQDGDVWKAKDDPDYDTKEERTAEGSSIIYGTGAANVNINGGTIHRVFGGSNTKGNVRITAVTMLEEAGGCPFCVDEAYGGGKSAPMDAEAKLLMACIPGLKEAYGGAQNAEIDGDVTLNITNGTFERIFGGNDEKGYIKGTITVNIEETGCKPIIIGELYGGGNQAPYTAPEGKHGPTLNVRSFTSIGDIYGGGLGSTATVTGDTYVNINVSEGRWHEGDYEYATDPSVGVNDKITELNEKGYHAPEFTSGMGSIHTVFGGGNAAPVTGNTNVNVGTSEYEEMVSVATGDDVTDYYTRSGEGTEASPYTYTKATGTAEEGTTYYQKVKGANITGNVYGGGNNAVVTGDTHVVIGEKYETPAPTP